MKMCKLLMGFVCLWFLLITPVLAEEANIAGTLKAPRRDVCRVPSGPTNAAYLADMKVRFYRNLPASIFLEHDVVLRFFLTAKGCIRDVSIVKSSGSKAVDIACVDAAYCASPLPDPPVLRTLLKAPPEAFIYEPDEYGEGVYTFTFTKSPPNNMKELKGSSYALPLIPNEVLFRYPGLFTVAELTDATNKISVKADDPYFIECMRNPWALQYTMSDPPSKSEVLNLSHCIKDKYISKKRVAAQHAAQPLNQVLW